MKVEIYFPMTEGAKRLRTIRDMYLNKEVTIA